MSDRVLVTGGTGFLGEHVIRALLAEKRGWEVRALARSHSPVLDTLGVEQAIGDIRSASEVRDALEGCSTVYHCAGVVSREPEDSQLMMRVHIDGTRCLLEQAAQAGVHRVVVASSSGTIAISTEEEFRDEESGHCIEVAIKWPYYASKIYQEKLALHLGKELGIEVVVINPSLLLGPGDRRLSSTGDVLKFLRGQIPVIPPGGINFVDVRDAARAAVAAMERGRPGEVYLLGGPNWTFEEFFGRLQRAARSKSRPRLKAPSRLSRFGAKLVDQLYRSGGKEAPVDAESVEMGEHYWWFESRKAEAELGFEHRDPGITLADTVRYLRQGIAADC